MIVQAFNIKNYWRVVVYYNVSYNSPNVVKSALSKIGFKTTDINSIIDSILTGQAKAVTCSNLNLHISIILFGRHESCSDYIDSVIHGAEHVKQNMLEAYNIDDKGEPPAYTIGYIAKRLLRFFISISQMPCSAHRSPTLNS